MGGIVGAYTARTARGSALQLQAGQARQTLRRETGQRVVLTLDEVLMVLAMNTRATCWRGWERCQDATCV